MGELLTRIFGEAAFMPHGHCYLWHPAMLWLQVLSNGLIGLSYLGITLTLLLLVRRIRDLPFQWMYVAFAVFIVTCGFSHFSDVMVIWHPAYWLDAGIRVVTAVASVGTAILLPPLVPRAVALAESAELAHERGVRLEQANRELAVLLDRTQELEQLKTQFFANVSHELRTPLSLILGPSERLLAGEVAPAQRRELEVIARNARSLLRHVDDLLDVARLDAGRLQPARARVDLAELIRVTAAQFESVAEERGVDLRIAGPEALRAELDPDQIQRVLLNLLGNAFKFTPAGGTIRCALRREGDDAVLEVADSGPGIHPQDRAAAFERFRQLDGGSTRRFGGSGLGLAIVREFVELHGGAVAIDDAPEGGALLRVRLPLSAPPGAEVAAEVGAPSAATREHERATVDELRPRSASAPLSTATPAATGADARPRVLIAEDNPDLRRFLVDSLAGEYRVETAVDGEDALARAQARPPDLVLSDMMMPRLSGDLLVRELRARPSLAAVPVIVLTAKADEALCVRMLREGAQDYVMKPFSVEELRARVANLVTMKRARDLLQRELDTQLADLVQLAGDVVHQRRELTTAVEALQVARAQAEAASRAKTQFLGLVSHELRTPLAGLQLHLERLLRDRNGELTPRLRESAERMSRSTARLVGLVESLLSYAGLQTGRMNVQIGVVDVAAVASEVAQELEPSAQQKGLALTVTRDRSAIPPLRSDPRLVRLVLGNLVANAIKFTREGAVQIVLAYRDGQHELTVEDSGPGIAPEDRVRVFQPFEQLEPLLNKHTPGVGLGLALVREMVTSLGGTIELRSEVGVGSTFVVRLPEAPAERPPT